MSQNTSTAVMARRDEPKDSLDLFPTPCWATRALCEHVLAEFRDLLPRMIVWEPACGFGHMARPLGEYVPRVHASDVYDHGFGAPVHDFLQPYLPDFVDDRVDMVVTNPPFRLAAEFVTRGLEVAPLVCMLVRTAFLEGVGRYNSLFEPCPPLIVAPFVERVPMVKGRVDQRASTATSYTWIVWRRTGVRHTLLRWIPPCRKALERTGDYD